MSGSLGGIFRRSVWVVIALVSLLVPACSKSSASAPSDCDRLATMRPSLARSGDAAISVGCVGVVEVVAGARTVIPIEVTNVGTAEASVVVAPSAYDTMLRSESGAWVSNTSSRAVARTTRVVAPGESHTVDAKIEASALEITRDAGGTITSMLPAPLAPGRYTLWLQAFEFGDVQYAGPFAYLVVTE